ncbi:T9SS type A sorting domain-containing protein [Brumimicrobium oceani]|uniref:Secretion system C-terminal sorting domain-containing protein n=1 Tax=Brumimicrobium oceani TaxID=2100725 RepID=A0A2U2XF50_9FLAO|nr:T9SS type A sorting domain-containing protein [Brumimicrobium oceani]PWH86432.1 hypothetical protein DIT68_04125 [Brumimicrobium oceani]
MKKHYSATLLLFISISYSALSQTTTVISQFTWDVIGQDPEIADVGPNATSISPIALTAANGAGGTNGLNAGPNENKQDINMFFANDPIFNVEGIDLSIDYQRDESQGTFFKRGSVFSFLSASQLIVSFKLKNPNTPALGTSVNSGNVFNIPLDDIFRTYRFKYSPNTGTAQLFVDGDEKWSANFDLGMVLDWTGAGQIKIGELMDGSGMNKTIYDNYILKGITYSPLPIKLISFSSELNIDNSTVDLNWRTASETNNDYFTIEKSQDGFSWEILENIEGAGNSTASLSYSTTDRSPYNGVSYYRLKQTDYDGKYEYSPTISVNLQTINDFTMHPNPIQQGGVIYFDHLHSTSGNAALSIYNSNGVLIESCPISQFESAAEIKNDLKPGVYFIKFENQTKKLIVKS